MAFTEKSVRKLMKTLNSRSGRTAFCSAVIAAAGFSERMAGEDKLFHEICGAPVLIHTLNAFQRCASINEIIVVVRESSLDTVSDLLSRFRVEKVSKIVIGGPTRAESVLNGLLAVSGKAQLVAIQDGARPCVDDAIITSAVSAAAMTHAAAPAIQVISTVKRAEAGKVIETVDRGNLFEIQTPQVFNADLIKAALTNAVTKHIEVTDDCMAVELLGFPVYLTKGARSNIKITTSEDFIFAEAVLSELKVEG